MDDTSCTNEFAFPMVSILCRDDSDTVHCVAWGVIKNRTTDSFGRFFTFVAKYFRDIKTFVWTVITHNKRPLFKCLGHV